MEGRKIEKEKGRKNERVGDRGKKCTKDEMLHLTNPYSLNFQEFQIFENFHFL